MSEPQSHLSRNIVTLGWVSCLTDMASEMLYPIVPLFVTGVLGASPAILGLIEGVAEGGSALLRWVAGFLSDRFRQRKPFVVCGYALSAFSKPVMGLAAFTLGWPLLLGGRCADRLGKAVRTAPRDALIVDSTAPESRGSAFGLHRAMDTAGAVIGPGVALLILHYHPTIPLQYLFFVALIPGLFSSLLALIALRDIPHEPVPSAAPPRLWQHYPRAFWYFVASLAIFSLGNSSDSFLILRGREVGLSFTHVILAFMIYNIVYALLSWPMGRLSDRIGRRPVIAVSWLIYAAVYLGFAALHVPRGVWALMAVYGVYQAMTDGVSKALVGDLVDKSQRAAAIGLLYSVAGACQLAASLFAGFMWNRQVGGLRIPFAAGALLSLLAAVVFLVWVHPGQAELTDAPKGMHVAGQRAFGSVTSC